jgi:hypothetical protein
MLPEVRGTGVAATSDGAFRVPPGAGPRMVKALEVPGAARFGLPRIGAPMRRGPPAPGVHLAGTFALFQLPEGRPWCFIPELDPAAVEEADTSPTYL